MVDDIYEVLGRYEFLSGQIREIKRVEGITKISNPSLVTLVSEHKSIKDNLQTHYHDLSESKKQDVISGEDILIKRKLKINEIDDDGNKIESEKIHIGIDFIHEQFNSGKLFPKSTFMSMAAAQGVGKSDYLYRMANRLLVDGYNVLLLSFEFGEERLGDILASVEDGGKDRLSQAREQGLLSNLMVNYYSRDLEALETLVDMANTNGIDCILIDSFGEVERGRDGEYVLQQNIAMLLNKKKNDYGMFIVIIAQVNNSQVDGEYKIKGGNDLAYKPDLSIFIKKVFEEDVGGDRVVHLIKNRDDDCNGKTIITEYDFNKREPVFKCDYDPSKHSAGVPTYKRKSKKPEHTDSQLALNSTKIRKWTRA